MVGLSCTTGEKGPLVFAAASLADVLEAIEADRSTEANVAELRTTDQRPGSVFVRVGDWWADLTRDAVDDLELTVGRRVWLVVKSHSWRVVTGSRADPDGRERHPPS